MFVEDDGGAVGAWHELRDIEELDRQLDTRGTREHGLKAGLQKAWPSIQRALTHPIAGKGPQKDECMINFERKAFSLFVIKRLIEQLRQETIGEPE